MYKPIQQNYLYQAILKCVSGNYKAPKKKPVHKVKILIAEDQKLNSFTLKEMLVALGCREKNISIVENGEKCIKEVEEAYYDVILMDIIMPIIDGLQASKKILNMDLRKRPTIIITSAAVLNSDKEKCSDIGIHSYLEKPISEESLKTALLPLISFQKKHKKHSRKKQK